MKCMEKKKGQLMDLQAAKDKLDKLGIDWEKRCPDGLYPVSNGCPKEFKTGLALDTCPLCWIKYGDIK